MTSQVLFEDMWGEIIDRPSLELVEIRWYDTTADMTGDEFNNWLNIFAGYVETLQRPGCLVDAVQLRLPIEKIELSWRDKNIIPRYNAAGVAKFAFLVPTGMPLIGAEPVKEGPATFPTGYFDRRFAAVAWITKNVN